jgi:putative transposase
LADTADDPEQLLEVRLLRRCTYSGRLFGGDDFVQAMEERFQRKWRKWGFEQVLAATAWPGQ